MKLVAVSLKNFRGYEQEQWVEFGDLTTIVGRNDAGKSTILEALDIFFGSGVVKADSTDKNVLTRDNYFEISCKFSDLPVELILDSQAQTSLGAEYLLDADGYLHIRRKWICTGAKPKEEIHAVCQHPSNDGLGDLIALSNAALKKLAKDRLDPAAFAAVNKSTNPQLRAALWGTEELVLEEKTVPLSKEDGGKIWQKLATYLPHFALFQSDRKSTDADDEVQEPMKLAIAAALAEEAVQGLLTEIVEAVRTRATELATRTHEALAEIDPALAEGLIPDFKSDPRWNSLFSVALRGSNGVAINKRGSGVRRLILVSFFKAEAKRNLEENDKASVIYALEEPETSQHPHNQRILLDSFSAMADAPGTQLILTSHSPGFVSHLPAKSLRYVRKDPATGVPAVSEGTEETWTELANELGVQPDNRVVVLICVEGPHDVTSLQRLSQALHASEPEKYPDLTTDHRFAFVPQGGGTLGQWVSNRYLAGFGRKEFHLYDGDVEKYKNVAEQVNARGDGSIATTTKRLMMENYLHPDAILQALGIRVEFGDQCNVPDLVEAASKNTDSVRPMRKNVVKARLADQGFGKMTAALLDDSDPDGEVRNWFENLGVMARS
ncbi:ATP-binding protein [Glutamicibacter protophormiae]|uniref:ATP-binding protein n=1 Tax=Glutamicibacter protophormiae TaxID=37930 RepID=UPI002A83919E|nr:ATP-binding protein [Glutamicibacter protophormiae]WPR65158.1 ATP-binding protein [Glutamicibacter protophormiae]WPR68655.1 ATP-binding protein [Glutamicibacter protophormiae]